MYSYFLIKNYHKHLFVMLLYFYELTLSCLGIEIHVAILIIKKLKIRLITIKRFKFI